MRVERGVHLGDGRVAVKPRASVARHEDAEEEHEEVAQLHEEDERVVERIVHVAVVQDVAGLPEDQEPRDERPEAAEGEREDLEIGRASCRERVYVLV